MTDPTPAQKLIDSFAKAVFGSRASAQATLQGDAAELLPKLKSARQNGDLTDKVANAPHVYSWVMESIEAEEISEKFLSVSREAVAEGVARGLTHRPATRDGLLKNAAEIKNVMLTMSEADHISFIEGVYAVLPTGLQEADRALRQGKPIADDVREVRALAASVPDAAIADVLAQRNAELDAEAVTTQIYGFLQQFTPERMQILLDHVRDNYDGATFGQLLKRGWDALEEVLQGAENGNFMRLENPKKVQAFGRTLHETLSVLEDGFTAAGLSVPPLLQRMLLDQADSGQILRAAHELTVTNAAKYGIPGQITVSKPLKLKGAPAP